MTFRFERKTIFILSPDRWGTMRISKHHYAIALAERGNKVFFIEPPDLRNKKIEVRKAPEHPELNIISYRPVYRAKRFLPAVLYRMLLKKQVKMLLRAADCKPDITWCFDPYRFENLAWFGAANTIFHAVDLFGYPWLPPEINTADFCLAVSDSIRNKLLPSGKPVHFINHGAGKEFVQRAALLLEQENFPVNSNKQIVVGYAGNLLMQAIDHSKMTEVISRYPDLHFVFWGQYEKGKGGMVGYEHDSVTTFINFLRSAKNVQLRGPVLPEVMQEEMQRADLFWICWKLDTSGLWDGSNSHKILEYLSTGKPVVAHDISTYRGTDLFNLCTHRDNADYLPLFQKTIDTVRTGETNEIRTKRLKFVLDNSYPMQISRIESILNQVQH